MAFPLVGAAIAADIDVQALDLQQTMTMTRAGFVGVNSNAEHSLFPETARAVAVLIDLAVAFVEIDVVATRQWNGIGGVGYLPSFPQLERHVTTWPHAT